MSNIIDLSHWNDVKDWDLVAKSVDGVILKCGGTDSKNGEPYTDVKYNDYYKECKARGISVGAYWFVGNNCTSQAQGINNALEFIKRLEGKAMSLPVFIDFETSTPSAKRGNTDAVISFCNTMESHGYFVGIYASDTSGFSDRLVSNDLISWLWWVAKYSTKAPTHKYDLWQYTSSGSVPGIIGRVDMSRDNNKYMEKVSKLIVERGFNGYKHQETKAKIQMEIYTDDFNWICENFNGSTFADKVHECIFERW